ncbi:PilZ domain-containing protein [Pseudoalteromonas sp. SSM20]|uniref:PilZ domain-containing protein n=1 Tax=Pseudoalteromonas sp. SSM20 TaxID=3139394 RepID=UPI003BA87BFB
MQERRQFTRIIYRTPATLTFQGVEYSAELLDLSLKGALIKKPENWPTACDLAKSATLSFQLSNSDIIIEMMVSLAHVENTQLGLRCEQIEIDSVTHLKRLIELNMGDEEELYRELEHLSVLQD